MKKHVSFAIFILVLTAIPASGQAQYCFGYPPFCQYLADTGFDQGRSYWVYSFGSGQATVADPCAWGGGTTNAAYLEPGDRVVQEFYTDTFGALSWAISLDLYKTTTNVTSNDYFTVQIYNGTTNLTETRTVSAANYPGLCGGGISFTLSNDYRDSRVRVFIRKGPYATSEMYIDDVNFFGRMY